MVIGIYVVYFSFYNSGNGTVLKNVALVPSQVTAMCVQFGLERLHWNYFRHCHFDFHQSSLFSISGTIA